jgi:hypothetical protein
MDNKSHGNERDRKDRERSKKHSRLGGAQLGTKLPRSCTNQGTRKRIHIKVNVPEGYQGGCLRGIAEVRYKRFCAKDTLVHSTKRSVTIELTMAAGFQGG